MGWEAVAAISGAVGAFGSLGGAVAAWRAASASRATAQDALKALAIGIRPSVQVWASTAAANGEQRLLVWVGVDSEVDASDVDVTVHLRSGHRLQEREERLGRARSLPPGGAAVLVHGPVCGDAGDVVDRIVVRFSDVRRICRYEQVVSVPADRDGGSLPLPGSIWMCDVDERQISGPA